MKTKILELARAAGATSTEFGRWRWRRTIPWRWQVLILLMAMARGEVVAPADLLLLKPKASRRRSAGTAPLSSSREPHRPVAPRGVPGADRA